MKMGGDKLKYFSNDVRINLTPKFLLYDLLVN